MALHIADTGPPGAGWCFNNEFRLRQVVPADVQTCCGIANKMCYWLGCPMVTDVDTEHGDLVRPGVVRRGHTNTALMQKTEELLDR